MGYGIYMRKDKQIYFKGKWVENQIQGFGIYVNKTKQFIYKGNFLNTYFKDDKINGFDIYHYNKDETIIKNKKQCYAKFRGLNKRKNIRKTKDYE